MSSSSSTGATETRSRCPDPGLARWSYLHGQSLGGGSERIELVQWQTSLGNPQIVVRADSELWPDVRVVAENASVSLWLRPDGQGEMIGGLPGIYAPLFPAGSQVVLALRMLGVRADLPAITIPLTRAEKPLQ
jgi:hypothetical protein